MDRDQSIIGIIVVFIILMLLFFAASALGGGAGGGGGGGGGGAGVPCAGTSECPAGQICLNGLCVPAGSCGSDSDCPAGSLCVNGMCNSDAECSAGVDCPFGECVNGQCSGCGSDADCAPDEKCINNVCSPSAPGCSSDFDCPPGEKCKDGFCVSEGEAACEAAGGTWIESAGVCCGAGTTWNPSTETCKSSAEANCVESGGTWISETETCDCPPGENYEGGFCVSEGEAACEAAGGTWIESAGVCCGAGTTWNPSTETCQSSAEASCVESGGTWISETETCDCPPGLVYAGESCVECIVAADCPPGMECNDEGLCYAPCIACTDSADCAEGQVCSRKCCASKTGFSLIAEPFGTYALMATSFCDGCPAQDSLVTRMFLDPRLEDEQVGVTLFVEADDGARPSVEQGTVFVQILSLDMAEKEYCKMATDEDGEAHFNYSSYEFCEDLGCKITFTFCCADISEGCLIPICLNDPMIQDLSDVPTTCPTGSSGGGISIWPTKAQVDGEFVNLYPSIDSISIPPKPKLMGMEFAFQLCFPILVIFGLLSAAMFASGRNPFEMFSLYSPRYKRAPERAIRPRGMNWNVNSVVGIIASVVQSGVGMSKGDVSKKTTASKSEGKMPGLTVGGRIQGAGGLGSLMRAGRGGVVSGSKQVAGIGGKQVAGPGGAKQVAGPTGLGAKGPMVSMDSSGKQMALGAMGMKEMSAGKQIGTVFATIGGSFALKLLAGSPLFSWLVSGVQVQTDKKDANGNIIPKKGADGKPVTDKNGKPVPERVWVSAFDGLMTKLNTATSNLEGAAKVINKAVIDTEKSFKEEIVTDNKGNATGKLTHLDVETNTQVEKVFKGSETEVKQQISAEKSTVLAPLLAAQSVACQAVVAEKQAGFSSALESLSDSKEASEDMKKQIKEMDNKKAEEIEARLTTGKASLQEAYFAAMFVKESGDSADGQKISAALGSFVSSGNFDKQLGESLKSASASDNNTPFLWGSERMDVTGVAGNGLFIAGVVGHQADENGNQNLSTACAGKISAMIGDEKNPGIAGNLLTDNLKGNPLILSENKEKLADMVKEAQGTREYVAARTAEISANNAFARAESEVYYSNQVAVLDAKTEKRELTTEETKALGLGAALTDTAAGLNLISDAELMKRAAVEKSLDPAGQYKELQSSTVAAASEELNKGGKAVSEIASAQLSAAYVNDYLADKYKMGPGEMGNMIEQGNHELYSHRLDSGKERLQESESPRTLSELNKARVEEGLPAMELPKSFNADDKVARETAAGLLSGLNNKDDDKRQEALAPILSALRDQVPPMPSGTSESKNVGSELEHAYAEKGFDAKRAAEEGTRSETGRQREAETAMLERREQMLKEDREAGQRQASGGGEGEPETPKRKGKRKSEGGE